MRAYAFSGRGLEKIPGQGGSCKPSCKDESIRAPGWNPFDAMSFPEPCREGQKKILCRQKMNQTDPQAWRSRLRSPAAAEPSLRACCDAMHAVDPSTGAPVFYWSSGRKIVHLRRFPSDISVRHLRHGPLRFPGSQGSSAQVTTHISIKTALLNG